MRLCVPRVLAKPNHSLTEAARLWTTFLPETACLTERADILQDGVKARSDLWQTEEQQTDCYFPKIVVRLKSLLPEVGGLTERVSVDRIRGVSRAQKDKR